MHFLLDGSPLDELYTKRLHECADGAVAQFGSAVRPIYGAKPRLTPEPIGSCFLLQVKTHRYVVTAAHVGDHLETLSLFIGGTSDPVQVLGTFISTKAPNGDRKRDKNDFAFCALSDDAVKRLGDVTFIAASDVSHNRAAMEHRVFMLMGYPLKKNRRRIDGRARIIRPVRSRYIQGVKPMPELAAALGVSGDDHLFQPFDEYSNDTEGNRVLTMNPRGSSGGPLIDLGNFASPEIFVPDAVRAARLAGMFIERNEEHQAYVHIRIQKILDAIAAPAVH